MKRRSGLGRGLDALLPSDMEGRERDGLRHLPIDSIRPNPRQPRRSFDDDELAGLAASIAGVGVLQPVVVRVPSGGGLELVAGERRLRAARLAGLELIPAIVVETDDRGSLERALVENVHRADLNPLEEAAAYRELIDESGSTQEALAHRIGKSRAAIANALRLLDLPASIQRHLIDRRLTGAHALVLLALAGNPFMERLAQRVATEGLSVRETQELVRKHQAFSGVGPRRTSASPHAAAAKEAQRKLAEYLQTRVRVDAGKRKGRIVIDFVSLEELERIAAIIAGETPGATARNIVIPD